eukprot:g19168.t1
MRTTRMFLLQKKGPTRFVVRGETSDRKFTVLVGSRARCSCGVPLCLHHLFVMLKVLKVSPTNPLAWQTSLIDSEVDSILDGVDFGATKDGRHGGDERAAGNGAPRPGQHREFLRRGAGRTSAGGSGCVKESGGDGVGSEGVEGGGARRLDIVPGEVCPVCQEEMEEDGRGDAVPPVGAAATAADGRLTYCRDGCGNNMHAREEVQPRAQGASGGRLRGRKSGGSGGGAVAAVVPVTCRSCGVKVQAVFFRCLVCIPAGAWDLCRRCYAVSGVRRSRHGGGSALGPCTPVGKGRHPFVQGEAATDPPEWKPAEPPDGARRRSGRGVGGVAGTAGSAAAAGVLSLQGREITTADFELLLTLDASTVPPLHDHLLQALPPHDETESADRGGSFFSPPALHLRPPAGAEQPDPTSDDSGIGDNDGHSRFPGVPPLDASTFPSRSVERATTVAEVLQSSSPVSTPRAPSLGDLVAAAAVSRDAAAAAAAAANAVAAEARGDEAAAEGEDAEATANPGGVPPMPTTAAPSFVPDEIAPVSGSFPVAPVVTCCCCAHIGAVEDTIQATENSGGVSPSRSTATRLMEQQQQRRRRRSCPPSSSSPIASSQPPLRRLPCGHSAHEACLIPLILESVGRGDPSRCMCPLDSSPIFPALSRHRRRVRRPRPGTDHGVPAVAASACQDHRRPTRSASPAAPPTVGGSGAGGGADRHARAAATRELLRRNTAAGFGFGGVNAADALGIALFGSGLAQHAPPPPPPPPPPPIPPPQSTRGHATATAPPVGPRPRESSSTIRIASTRENGDGSMLRRAGGNGRKDGENDRVRGGGGGSGSGSGPRGCRNAGRSEAGGPGPRDGSLADEPVLDGTALFVGGEGIVDASGGDSGAGRTAGRPEDRGGPEARGSRRRRRLTPAGVVRGSTVGSSSTAGRGSGGTGRDENRNNQARASGVRAADSADMLALTTRSFERAIGGKGRGVEESCKAAGHPPPRRGSGGDETGGRGSGRGRGTLGVVVVGSPSDAAGPETVPGVPPAGHPIPE